MPDSNFVESTLDAAGDLYLKYFFADSSITEHPNGDQKHFSLNKEALAARDNEAIGLPFTILPSRDLSIKRDFHPWHPKGGAATFDEHIAFAKSYSPGHIVAITSDTKLVGASIDAIKQNGGRFAIIKITDSNARDAFRKDPNLIPKAVSPGFMNFEVPNYDNVRNFKWVHLAAVPRGAYGDKATVYASCLGGNECINNLVGASVAELYEKTKDSYCPVGASENLLTSHTILNAPNFNMSDIANTTGTKPVDSIAKPAAPSSNPPNTTGAPIANTTKPIVRLKNPNVNSQAVTQQGNLPVEGNDDIAKLREEFTKMQEWKAQQERREQIKQKVPKELFINKGKFDEKGYNAEVEKRLASGASDEQLDELYMMMIEKQKLINAGFGIPESNNNPSNPNQPTPEMANQIPNAPTGGSVYQTPTQVPGGEPTGGSTGNDYVSKSINNLLRYTIRR